MRCMFASLVSKPINTPFRFKSRIIALVISNFTPYGAVEEMIALVLNRLNVSYALL